MRFDEAIRNLREQVAQMIDDRLANDDERVRAIVRDEMKRQAEAIVQAGQVSPILDNVWDVIEAQQEFHRGPDPIDQKAAEVALVLLEEIKKAAQTPLSGADLVGLATALNAVTAVVRG